MPENIGLRKTFHLRDLILFFLIFFLIVSVGYKYLEWNFFNNLSLLQATNLPEELSIIERSNEFTRDSISSIKDITSDKKIQQDRLKIYDELDGKINLNIDITKTYLNTLKDNSKKYKPFIFVSNLVVGGRGSLARQIVSTQIEYYEKEIQAAEDEIIDGYLLKNIFSLSKDKYIMSMYDKKTSESPKTLSSKYFSEVASLEKYTRNDFEFPEQDSIKEKHPYGYETLHNNKEYIGSYYSIVKDFVTGDYDSAAYKYSKLQDQYLKLNVDMDKLFAENQSMKQDRQRRIIELITSKNVAIKEYKNKNMGKYPLLLNIEGWKEDLEMCQIYDVKGSLLAEISKKPISAKTLDEFMEELAQVGPSTTMIDDKIDREIIKYTNSEDKITYQCLDRDTGKEYTFITEN